MRRDGLRALPLHWQLFLVWAFSGLALLIDAVVTHYGLVVSQSATEEVLRRSTIVAAANALMKTVVDAETGERGFVATRDPVFLEPYDAALKTFPSRLGELQQLVSDDGMQKSRLTEVAATFADWRWSVAEPNLKDATVVLERMRAGKARVDRIRNVLDDFVRIESAHMDVLTRESRQSVARSDRISTISAAAALMIAAFLAAYLSTSIGRSVRDLASAAREIAEGRDEARVPVGGRDELAALAAAFNQMADRLVARRRDLTELNETLDQRVIQATANLRQRERQLERSEQLLRALARRVENIREQERAEVAREIHDVLGQQLTGLKMDVGWVLRRLTQRVDGDTTAPRQRLQTVLEEVDATIATVQRIATGLRPAVLDDLGLVAALRWQGREFERRSGIALELALPEQEPPDLDMPRATALFRIFQELLTNVARHASASQVRVGLSQEGDSVVLEVKDNGRGMGTSTTSASSLGLMGIRERAHAFGGELSTTSEPGEGTRARVSISLTSTREGP